jgi:ubiquitin C-terminal hydrolase
VTYDATLDLNLDIGKCPTLQKALRKFTAREKLTHDNSYKCDGCQHKVKAIKQLTVHRAPAVLSIQLKRFDLMGGWGGKINKFVECVISTALFSCGLACSVWSD